MNTEKIRAGFEAYATEKGWGDCLGRNGENYSDWSVNPMWLAWQASRAELVVELPDACAYEGLNQELGSHVELSYEPLGHDPVGLIRLDDTRAAIEAAGVKCK